MELIKTKGLVLRSVNIGEYDKMLTVLTAELGKISVLAKGAKSLKHGGNSNANVFCYSDFVLYAKKDIYMVSQANGIESFFGLSGDLNRLNCAANLVEFVEFICQDEQEAGEILRIILNSLYALATLHKNPLQVSVAFYLKSLAVIGFEPELQGCCACGNEECLNYFSACGGGVICGECAPEVADKKKISSHGLAMMQYINCCDIKQLFKFDTGEDVLTQVYEIVNAFVTEHLDYKPKHAILKDN